MLKCKLCKNYSDSESGLCYKCMIGSMTIPQLKAVSPSLEITIKRPCIKCKKMFPFDKQYASHICEACNIINK